MDIQNITTKLKFVLDNGTFAVLVPGQLKSTGGDTLFYSQFDDLNYCFSTPGARKNCSALRILFACYGIDDLFHGTIHIKWAIIGSNESGK